MPRALAATLFLLLAACARPATPPDTLGFRATGAAIYSNAVMAPGDLVGQWRQVADFATPAAPPCAAGTLTIKAAGAGLQAEGDLCLAGQRATGTGVIEPVGPGRFRIAGADPAGLGVDWWVLWLDADQRTLVLGTPSGRFGLILDRDATLPPDRAAAARDILAWNGYDLSRLRPVAAR